MQVACVSMVDSETERGWHSAECAFGSIRPVMRWGEAEQGSEVQRGGWLVGRARNGRLGSGEGGGLTDRKARLHVPLCASGGRILLQHTARVHACLSKFNL